MRSFSFEDFRSQGEDIVTLHHQIAANHLAHAILITGEPGTGKRTFARLIASALVCKAGKDAPCGTCSECRLASADEHPDIIVIQKGIPLSQGTTKGRSTIPADDIREVILRCSQYTYEGGNRVIIIQDAENMTVQAQNCLLKILEEPPEHTYFLLTSCHPDQLLITVRSRCRPVKLSAWETSYIRDILLEEGTEPEKAQKTALASNGSIGYALQLAADNEYWELHDSIINAFFRSTQRSDILSVSTAWKDRKSEAEILFGILEEQISVFLRYRLQQNSCIFPETLPPEWKRFSEKAPLERFLLLSDKIKDARKQNSYNVNFQAIIEQLLLVFIGERNLWEK